MPDSQFKAGQMWQYKTRPGEEKSRLTVVKVEGHAKLGTIVHIQLKDVAIKSSHGPGGVSRDIAHLPYAEQAVADSVTTLESESSSPTDWEEGYRQWKSAFDAGKAGIWKLPVSEAVDAMEQILSQQ